MTQTNTLYYGDNLDILRKRVQDETVDLIYLDPPFNSARDYNVLFREQSGEPAQAQIKAFTDTWQWSERAYVQFCEECPKPALVELLQGFVKTLGRNDVTAYLVMMAPRLMELHRVLKRTGSLYLHCDPTASHYLKVMLDVIFGARNFKNEIIWQRITSKGNVQRKFGAVHDVLLYYAKQRGSETWNQVYRPLREEYASSFYRYVEEGTGRRYSLGDLTAPMQRASRGQIYEWRGITPPPTRCWVYSKEKMDELYAAGRIVFTKNGFPRYKRYLDEVSGEKVPDIWDDIFQLSTKEALGYPTQKPLALLERIILASSNEDDVVLDPFCGCGTAIVAAQKLQRRWIGIDITHLAIALIKYRLADMFDLREGKDYQVVGEPTTVEDARTLAHHDRDEFQRWAIGLIPRARPYQDKKGADTGIDGVLFFKDDPSDPKKVVIQVKSGHVSVKDIRDFRGVIEREKATLGLFVTLCEPTRAMLTEAQSTGFYITPLGRLHLPRLQIRTIEQLLRGEGFQIPGAAMLMGVSRADRVQQEVWQGELEM